MLAACGGGNSSAPIPAASPASRQSSAKATFVVKIPAKVTTSARASHYITAGVQGIEFDVTQAGNSAASTSVFYVLDAQQPYCSTPSGGGLTCTVDVDAMPGDDTFSVTTFDEPEKLAANIVSVGSIEKTISAESNNTVNIVTYGVPTFFSMSLDNPFPAAGTPDTQSIHLLALDTDGNVIIGTYDTPIAIANNDQSGTIQISATSAADSAQASDITVSYNGTTPTQGVMISATSNSPMALNWNGSYPGRLHYWPGMEGVVSTPSALLFANASASPQTITLNTSGGAATAPFTATTDMDWFNDRGVYTTLFWSTVLGCQGIVTVGGSSPTFTITPVHTGVCSLDVRDSGGHFGVVPIVVQSN
jgi:hypothetical protein